MTRSSDRPRTPGRLTAPSLVALGGGALLLAAALAGCAVDDLEAPHDPDAVDDPGTVDEGGGPTTVTVQYVDAEGDATGVGTYQIDDASLTIRPALFEITGGHDLLLDTGAVTLPLLPSEEVVVLTEAELEIGDTIELGSVIDGAVVSRGSLHITSEVVDELASYQSCSRIYCWNTRWYNSYCYTRTCGWGPSDGCGWTWEESYCY